MFPKRRANQEAERVAILGRISRRRLTDSGHQHTAKQIAMNPNVTRHHDFFVYQFHKKRPLICEFKVFRKSKKAFHNRRYERLSLKFENLN